MSASTEYRNAHPGFEFNNIIMVWAQQQDQISSNLKPGFLLSLRCNLAILIPHQTQIKIHWEITMLDPKKLLNDLLNSSVPGTEGTVKDTASQLGRKRLWRVRAGVDRSCRVGCPRETAPNQLPRASSPCRPPQGALRLALDLEG